MYWVGELNWLLYRDIVTNAKASGATKVIGIYSPTPRNIIVKDHYKKLGFTKISDESEIETWELDISDFVALDFPMRLTCV